MPYIIRDPLDLIKYPTETYRKAPLITALSRSVGKRAVGETFKPGLVTNSVRFKDIYGYCTSIAVSNRRPLVAMSSSSPLNNLSIVEDLGLITLLEVNFDDLGSFDETANRNAIREVSRFQTPLEKFPIIEPNRHYPTHRVRKVHFAPRFVYPTDDPVSNPTQALSVQPTEPSQGQRVKPILHVDIAQPASAIPGTFPTDEPKPATPEHKIFRANFSQASTRSSTGSHQFLSTYNQSIATWDVTKTEAPLRMDKAGSALVTCASWSPHEPWNLIATGDSESVIRICDVRQPGDPVIWRSDIDTSHVGVIRDIRFNPFVPYWVASAREDGLVSVWDIRFSKNLPVAKVDGHLADVNSIVWSNSHVDMFATGASDRTFRLWCLEKDRVPVWDTIHNFSERVKRFSRRFEFSSSVGPGSILPGSEEKLPAVGARGVGVWGRETDVGPEMQGETEDTSAGAVVDVSVSPFIPDLYYSLSAYGQLSSQTIRLDAVDDLVPHKPATQYKETEIETCIWDRMFGLANAKIARLRTDSGFAEDINANIPNLQKLMETPSPIRATDWSVDEAPLSPDEKGRLTLLGYMNRAKEIFKTDLERYSYLLPPGFDMKLANQDVPEQLPNDDSESGGVLHITESPGSSLGSPRDSTLEPTLTITSEPDPIPSPQSGSGSSILEDDFNSSRWHTATVESPKTISCSSTLTSTTSELSSPVTPSKKKHWGIFRFHKHRDEQIKDRESL
ncbi:hypothetical protein BZG36_02165 [Bifiguratus adelaidae]|uniref:Uncharacterized protein n=1 Tax=Bifiguratus adelaidae TaxID=1938954 RepID=A0A261Y0R8_9FUNG|nr:hypothetical protein BZG36_02165 [Bifiguratus adelaidae]